MRVRAEVILGAQPEDVPAARRIVRAALGDRPPDVATDAELVVSELVTNAVLHGAAPVVVRVLVGERPRIEVRDAGRSAPIIPARRSETTTGRGLGLVAALAAAWGVEPVEGGGKLVWAELRDGPRPADGGLAELDAESVLAGWVDEGPEVDPTFTVRLGAVSTQLLLVAKAHMDDVVRELTLIQGGADTALPDEVAALVRAVTVDFAEARREIKRQAAAAAARGDAVTDLELHLGPGVADAGERYLAALDRADRYARGARLLTLAAPALHRRFRRWYVQAVVDQLRSLAAGTTPPAVVPFRELPEVPEPT